MQQGNYRAADVLRRLLARHRVPTDLLHRHPEPSPTVHVFANSHRYELRPVWIGEGFPQDVDRALASTPASLSQATSTVVVGHRLSQGAVQRVEALGLSWADERGRARIVGPPGLLIILDTPTQLGRPDQSFRWSTSAAAVGELLLWWRTDSSPRPASENSLPTHTQIASYLPVSVAQVSKVLNKFDQEGWTRKTGADRGPGAQRVLDDPSGLLSSWAAWQSPTRRQSIRAHAAISDPAAFYYQRLQPILPPTSHCLTGWLAADLRAPLSTSIPNLSLYVDSEVFDFGIDEVLETTGLRRVTSGQRVTFMRAEDHVLTLATHGPAPLASDARIYADLLTAGVRGEEAASHLREMTLGF